MSIGWCLQTVVGLDLQKSLERQGQIRGCKEKVLSDHRPEMGAVVEAGPWAVFQWTVRFIP